MSNKIFILSKNYSQFRQFRLAIFDTMVQEGIDCDIRDFIYTTPDTIRGYRDIWGYRINGWEQRNDAEEIVTRLEISHSPVTENFIEVQL